MGHLVLMGWGGQERAVNMEGGSSGPSSGNVFCLRGVEKNTPDQRASEHKVSRCSWCRADTCFLY